MEEKTYHLYILDDSDWDHVFAQEHEKGVFWVIFTFEGWHLVMMNMPDFYTFTTVEH